jgi:hypothetical protein
MLSCSFWLLLTTSPEIINKNWAVLIYYDDTVGQPKFKEEIDTVVTKQPAKLLNAVILTGKIFPWVIQ